MKRFFSIILFFILSANSIFCFAEYGTTPSLGGASLNALEPVGIFANALHNICFIIGVGFILGSIIRFREYRQNPSQTPISRPITILILGLVLLAIPIIAKLSFSAP